jgi:hypothetical protein
MSEIGALVGIYGAIDQVAQEDPALRTEVSRLLPLYADPELQWYDKFEAWLNETAHGPRTPFPTLPEALEELAGLDPQRRLRPRRLFAIAVAMRAFPAMRSASGELGKTAVAALSLPGLAAGGEEAHALHELLADEESLPAPNGTSEELAEWWENLITSGATAGLIENAPGMFPRPCSGRLVSMKNETGPIAALETQFVTDEVEFDQAIAFLQPENWPRCMPWFWCEMKQIGSGPAPNERLYKEVVSSDCGEATAPFTAETELDFTFTTVLQGNSPQAAIADYRLGPGRPRPADVIRVDQGSLVVAKTGAGQTPLRITTTKRIQFSYPFSSQALAIIMCAIGYTDAVGNLLCCTASGEKKDVSSFPGVPADPGNGAPGGSIPGSAVAVLSGCIEECMAGAQDWSRRIAAGPYTADKMAQDMADTWTRVLRKSAAVVEQGASRTQMSAATRTRARSEG